MKKTLRRLGSTLFPALMRKGKPLRSAKDWKTRFHTLQRFNSGPTNHVKEGLCLYLKNNAKENGKLPSLSEDLKAGTEKNKSRRIVSWFRAITNPDVLFMEHQASLCIATSLILFAIALTFGKSFLGI